jgi:regulator of protease activity HflC (stomatin/prohibitin superfamily)
MNDGAHETNGAPEVQEMPVEQQRASLVLRNDDVREARAASMEAANRSLADALRITYRLLQGVMVILVILFVFSGVQQIKVTERGVKVAFGEIVARNLEPGPQFSLPYPLGQIIKVTTTAPQQTITAFQPGRYDPSRSLEEQGAGGTSLRPGVDGSLLTADKNLVHARITVSYTRQDEARFLENLYTDDEEELMRRLVERATVQIVSQLTIDELLNRATTSGQNGVATESTIERRIRDAAQESIERLDIGLEIDQVGLRVFPPIRLYGDFNAVNRQDALANQARERAEQGARQRLNEVAGSAHQPLLDLIADYERQLATGREPEAEQTLELFGRVLDGEFDGRNVEIAGRTYDDVRVGGTVAKTINDARSYRQSVSNEARRTAERFEVALSQFRADPRGYLIREWTDAMSDLLSKPHVQSFIVTPGTSLELLVNTDPDIARAIEEARRIEQSIEAERLREQAQQEALSR